MEFFCSAYVLLFFVLFQYALPTTLKLERVISQDTNISDLRRRDQARHQSLSMLSFPLLGSADLNTYGLYFTRVILGSPPREFSLQIDTGCDISWVSCYPCKGCPVSSGFGIPLSLYNPQNSSSASQLFCSERACYLANPFSGVSCPSQSSQCSYALHYGDLSMASGFLVSDLLHFGSTNSSIPIIFGCSNYLSGRISRPDRALDGILGLGIYYPSIIPQLSAYGIPKVFSHCLRGDDGGGTLVVGEIQEAGLIYTPLVPHRPHYTLYLQSIAINGEKVPIDPAVFRSFTVNDGGAIVDSGTTLAILPAEAYDAFVHSLTAALTRSGFPISIGADQCFQASSRIKDVLPLVSFNFKGGASMPLKPENYLRWVTHFEDVHTWCLGFQKAQGISATVLGDIVLKDRLIVYDLERQRLGWVDFDCSRSINVSLTPHRSASSLSVDSLFSWILINIASFFIYMSMFL